MPTEPNARKSFLAARKAATPRPPQSAAPTAGTTHYDAIRAQLECDHFGAYVMINTPTAEYVVAPSTSQAHARFIERFSEDAPGWCNRIGASAFAVA